MADKIASKITKKSARFNGVGFSNKFIKVLYTNGGEDMAKLSIDNQTKVKINKLALKAIKKELCAKQDIELLIVNDDAIKELNKNHRKKNKPTDVLSFPVEYEFANFLGSIVISIDTAQKQADEQNHPLDTEMAILFIHGCLHLQGFDHEKDSGEMREIEAKICQKFSLPAPLTARYA